MAGVGDDATLLRGRCLHYGEGITFWPLVEALVPAGDRASVLVNRMTATGSATPEELFWEVRRLLEALAAERPVILHIDDLQWAEPMLLDLLDHVIDLSRGAPILLLCTARPELLEDRPAWGSRQAQRHCRGCSSRSPPKSPRRCWTSSATGWIPKRAPG